MRGFLFWLAISILSFPSFALAEKMQVWIIGTSITSGWTVGPEDLDSAGFDEINIAANQVKKTQAGDGYPEGILFEFEMPDYRFHIGVYNWQNLSSPQVAYGELQFSDGTVARTPSNGLTSGEIIYSDWRRDNHGAVRFVIRLK